MIKGANIMPKFEMINVNIVIGSEIAKKMEKKGLVPKDYELTPARTKAPLARVLDTLCGRKKRSISMEDGYVVINKSIEERIDELRAKEKMNLDDWTPIK